MVLDRDRCPIEVATVVSHPWMFAVTYLLARSWGMLLTPKVSSGRGSSTGVSSPGTPRPRPRQQVSA